MFFFLPFFFLAVILVTYARFRSAPEPQTSACEVLAAAHTIDRGGNAIWREPRADTARMSARLFSRILPPRPRPPPFCLAEACRRPCACQRVVGMTPGSPLTATVPPLSTETGRPYMSAAERRVWCAALTQSSATSYITVGGSHSSGRCFGLVGWSFLFFFKLYLE